MDMQDLTPSCMRSHSRATADSRISEDSVITDILFDLDGTLVDSAGDIINCLSRAYTAFSPELTVQIDKSHIGPPLKDIIRLITPDIDSKGMEFIIQQFRTCYDDSE